MITMLHYDAVRSPLPPEVATLTQSGPKKQPILTETQHLAYLQAHPYQQFTEEEMENVIKKYLYLLFTDLRNKQKINV
jgi:pre-mRNA-splicing factor CDC5/CEF1